MAEALTITHVIRAKPPGELGGAELHLLDLATIQAEHGHRVRVVFLGAAELSDAFAARGIATTAVQSTSSVRWLRALRRVLLVERPDVVHSHGYRADLVAAAARMRGRLRPVSAMTVHGFVRTSVGLRLLTRLDEAALRRTDLVVAVSSAEAGRLTRILRRPVVFIPNGIVPAPLVSRAEASARLGGDPGRRTVALIGRLSPEKRPDLFVSMAGALAATHPDVDFALVGSGPLTRETAALAAASRPARVRLTGLIRDVPALLAAVDVLVCASDTEGTPRVVVEAMSAGVPVVATGVGGLPDLVTHERTGLLVPPGSATALAAEVHRLLAEEELRCGLAARARARMLAEFSAAAMTDQVETAYRSAGAGRTAAGASSGGRR